MLRKRFTRANALAVALDRHKTAAEKDVGRAMAALRLMIDEHEKSTLQKISALRIEEMKRLKDYKTELKSHSVECDAIRGRFQGFHGKNQSGIGTVADSTNESSSYSRHRSDGESERADWSMGSIR